MTRDKTYKITELKKLKHLYTLTIDPPFQEADQEPITTIYATEDTLVNFMLSKQKILSPQDVRQIQTYANYSKGKSAALYYLSFKSRTEKELSRYLVEKGVTPSDLSQIMTDLKKIHLIDDEQYTRTYIEGKTLVGRHGPYQIQQKLAQKGIASDLASRVLDQLYTQDKQVEIAGKLADKLATSKSYKMPTQMLKMKIKENLVSKGFSYEVAEAALDSLDLMPDEQHEADLIQKEADKAYLRLSKRYLGYELKQKLSQALARKGFDWSLISDCLDHYEF